MATITLYDFWSDNNEVIHYKAPDGREYDLDHRNQLPGETKYSTPLLSG